MAFAIAIRRPAARGEKGGVEKRATLIGANFSKSVLHFLAAYSARYLLYPPRGLVPRVRSLGLAATQNR